jgi:hypothetical protein
MEESNNIKEEEKVEEPIKRALTLEEKNQDYIKTNYLNIETF